MVGLRKLNKPFQGSGDLLETLGGQDDLLHLVNDLLEVCVLVSAGKYTKKIVKSIFTWALQLCLQVGKKNSLSTFDILLSAAARTSLSTSTHFNPNPKVLNSTILDFFFLALRCSQVQCFWLLHYRLTFL